VSNRMRIGILGGDDLLYDLGEIGVELINLWMQYFMGTKQTVQKYKQKQHFQVNFWKWVGRLVIKQCLNSLPSSTCSQPFAFTVVGKLLSAHWVLLCLGMLRYPEINLSFFFLPLLTCAVVLPLTSCL
jgi:hypothetical protein